MSKKRASKEQVESSVTAMHHLSSTENAHPTIIQQIFKEQAEENVSINFRLRSDNEMLFTGV